ncbi:5'-methylthioadenosine/S-adenosylhomocysteine nucleosidase [Ureaplasma sp. ES3154-GEN]|uniref:5'-methylthioadenosine/S-adenosylhomocysteine nucleosidase n=1 Tax=Ureaplasma sp. ES3154-GEN TaxID=2984844 RepID=UPI0021E92471|nr:5'-methylthioadenosine/S-adenosylhomocysteine nucleosidase [Ureaplasma sp. ES3154-GEN]MCV3743304.1 5'-methylthioadenosine/S-adenosylhomocysteine nucleosidase [Ureaplasma sp. ES3154-GEN]
MIGIIVAMQDEVSYFLAKYSEYKIKKINGITYYIYKINHYEFVLVFSDVGLVNAAMTTSALINNFQIDFLVNVGSCGTNSPEIKVLTPYLVDNVQYMNVDLTAFGYQKNQIPRKPTNFLAHKDLSDEIAANLNLNSYVCGSSDIFVDHEQHNLINDFQPTLIDMELAAIAHVAYANFIPWISVKMVSDTLVSKAKTAQSHQDNLNEINLYFQDHLLEIIKTVYFYVKAN